MRGFAAFVCLLCLGFVGRAQGAETGPTQNATMPVENVVQLDNLPGIDAVVVQSKFYGYQSAVDRGSTGNQPAYNYSVDLMWDREQKKYRLYAGGRWRRPGIPYGDGDHILQYFSSTGQGGTWAPRGRPEFWTGYEEGHPGKWWSNNYLEPEVLKMKGLYHMFWQVQVNPGTTLDNGQTAAAGADRIGLSTSRDGLNWKRKTDRGIVVNIDRPANTALTHEEVIYVPDDPERKPWWLYLHYLVDGQMRGHVRIRSQDPTTFDWRERERCRGMSQLGNQMAYANRTSAGRIFVRITFTTNTALKREVPCLQFSRDGLSWWGSVMLEGSKDTAKNRNCYFLGISTLDGTGELERIGKNTYRALYGATTCNSPVTMEIFDSKIGVGEVVIRFAERRPAESSKPGASSDAN